MNEAGKCNDSAGPTPYIVTKMEGILEAEEIALGIFLYNTSDVARTHGIDKAIIYLC